MSAVAIDLLMLMRLITALAAGCLFVCLLAALKRSDIERHDLLAAMLMSAHVLIYRVYVLLVLDLNIFGSHLIPLEWIEMWATIVFLHGIITFLGYVLLVIYRNKGEV